MASSTPTSDRETEVKAVNGKRRGIACHQVIASLADQRPPSPLTLSRAARRAADELTRATYRQAVYQQLVTAAAVYYRLFGLPPSWSLTSLERPLTADTGRVDLVWSSPEGVLIDEIKSGFVSSRETRHELDEQVARYHRAGGVEFGDRFIGVRAIILTAPRRSFLEPRDGSRQRLDIGGPR